MNESTRTDETRLLELLSDRAAFGLTPQESAELAELLRLHPTFDVDTIDRAAATVELAHLPAAQEELPERVRRKIVAGANKQLININRLALLPDTEVRHLDSQLELEVQASNASTVVPWFVIAASALIAIGTFYFVQNGMQENPARQYRALLANAERGNQPVVQAKWIDPAAKDATVPLGDLLWSPTSQRGYMRFRNLPENDPKKEQYQLWIFDANQDERYPIDGGVFDIRLAEKDPVTGDFIVPIDAKLHVDKPTMFAVTIEKPGGVVVSTRERLPLLAKVE